MAPSERKNDNPNRFTRARHTWQKRGAGMTEEQIQKKRTLMDRKRTAQFKCEACGYLQNFYSALVPVALRCLTCDRILHPKKEPTE